jgi:hypothetical protein
MASQKMERRITWEEFETEFKPKKNTLNKREEYRGWLYEAYGEDEAFVRRFTDGNPNNVWTIIDGEHGITLGSGWRYDNRIGYIITELPCKKGESVTVQDEDDIVYDLDFEGIGKKFTEKQLAQVLREGGFKNDFVTKAEIIEFLIEMSIETIKSDEEAVKHINVLLEE